MNSLEIRAHVSLFIEEPMRRIRKEPGYCVIEFGAGEGYTYNPHTIFVDPKVLPSFVTAIEAYLEKEGKSDE